MRRAIDEMDRRRAIQEAHNAEHGIVPQSIYKSVDQVRLVTRVADARTTSVAESGRRYAAASGKQLDRDSLIEVLERQMREAAAQLDFEVAAQLRDQIFELKAEADPMRASPRVGRERARTGHG